MCGNKEYIHILQDNIWHSNYNKLKQYYSLENTTNVQKHEDKYLYNWCKSQRIMHKSQFKDPKKVELLNKMHFEWSKPKHENVSCFGIMRSKKS